LVTSPEGAFPVSITAVEPAVEGPHSIQAEHVVAGRYLLPDDGDAVFIGQGLASLLHVGVGERVMLVGSDSNEQMRQRTMTVVGIYDLGMAEAERRMLFITLPEAQTLYNLRDQVTEVTMVLDQVGQENAVMAPLSAAFPGVEVDSWNTLRPEMRQTMDTKAAVASFFMFVVVLIACIGVLNLMLMAVFERTREMGVLSALGLKGRQIMGLFLMEGALIGVVGAAIGCGLGLLLIFIVQQAGGLNFQTMANMGEITALMGSTIYPTVPLQTVVSRGLTVAVIAALASLYPAWQSSRQEPAEALHHV
jgi:ABC-type lipoprotein release transport system permease subunit